MLNNIKFESWIFLYFSIANYFSHEMMHINITSLLLKKNHDFWFYYFWFLKRLFYFVLFIHRETITNVRERERRNRQAVIAAKKNREIALQYLKDTMSQVRQRESEEEEKNRSDLSQRMNALLSLKKNIELNKVWFYYLYIWIPHIEKLRTCSTLFLWSK